METMPTPEPEFEGKIEKKISNFKTGETYTLVGGREMIFSEGDAEQIAVVCSQEEVYTRLFKTKFKNEPYGVGDARHFIEWLEKGWKEGGYFVFFIRDSENKIVGAIDIKSANVDRAEVGYWADVESSGFMTNALMELCSVARKAKYRKLFGEVRSDNTKSASVLERAGFTYVGTNQRGDSKDAEHLVYEKVLA